MKLLSTEFSQSFCHSLLPLYQWVYYTRHHPVFRSPKCMFFPEAERPNFTPTVHKTSGNVTNKLATSSTRNSPVIATPATNLAIKPAVTTETVTNRPTNPTIKVIISPPVYDKCVTSFLTAFLVCILSAR